MLLGSFLFRLLENILIMLITLLGSDLKTKWCKSVPKKVNVFLWRAWLDRLPKRFNLSKTGFDLVSICCCSCNVNVETSDHVFCSCSIALEVWRAILCDVVLPRTLSISEWMSCVDDVHMSTTRKEILEVVILVTCWYLWTYRKGVVFYVGNMRKCKMRKCKIFDSIKSTSFLWL